MNLLQTQHSFKVIFFQVDKEIRKNQDRKYEGTLHNIKKVIIKSDNRKSDQKKDDDGQRLKLRKMQEKTLKCIDEIQRLFDKCTCVTPEEQEAQRQQQQE